MINIGIKLPRRRWREVSPLPGEIGQTMPLSGALGYNLNGGASFLGSFLGFLVEEDG